MGRHRLSIAIAVACLATVSITAQRRSAPPADLQGIWTGGTLTPLVEAGSAALKRNLEAPSSPG